MTAFGVLAYVSHGLGLALVLVGLYRRDPAAQRLWGRVRGRITRWTRRLLRKPPRKVALSGMSTVPAMTSSGRLTVRPGQRKEGASHDERLDWLERGVDKAFSELDAEATYRTQDIGELRTKLTAVEDSYRSDVSELRRLLAEASIPERLEWWGVALVALGLASGILDAVFASA